MYWTTADDRQIKYEDLTDNHLLSIIKVLERNDLKFIYREGGGTCAEDMWYDETEIDFSDKYRDLICERNRRGV